MKNKLQNHIEQIIASYREGLSCSEIAKKCGCTRQTIYYHLHKQPHILRKRVLALKQRGLKTRKQKTKICANCGKEFYVTWWNKKKRKSSGRGKIFCSVKCHMEATGFAFEDSSNPIKISKQGYRYKTIKRGFHMYEHRFIAEKKLGRKLIKGEQVHHLDGNKLNNHPDNLVVVRTGEHWIITRLQHFKSFTPDFVKNVRDILKTIPTIVEFKE